jgi:hypothetical protein
MMQVGIENAFNNVSLATIFRELCDVGGPLMNMSLLPCCFMVLILLSITSMGDMWRGSPLLNHFQA